MTRLLLVEYTDPYSVWCWGAEPLLRAAEWRYGDAVEVRIVMGGLFEDFTPMREHWARMSGGQWKEAVLAFFRGVSSQHRMPMDPDAMMAGVEDFRSTWPACIAVKAAWRQGIVPGRRYLRNLREAIQVAGQPIQVRGVQVQVAEETGLDIAAFVHALESGEAESDFRDDLRECREQGVSGFPSFVFRNSAGDSRKVEGWQPWERFEGVIRKLAPDARPRDLPAASNAVLAFLEAYGRCATREVAEAFRVTEDEAEILLDEMHAAGTVRRLPAGTGILWERK